MAMADGSDPVLGREEESVGNTSEPPASATFETPAQYFEALEKWIQAAKMWQLAMASFPYLMSNQHTGFQFLPLQPNVTSNSILQRSQPSAEFYRPVNTTGIPQPQAPRQYPQANTRAGVEYRIAPVWKRIVAEVIDFLLLTLIKFIAGLVAAYLFGVIHWNFLNHSRKFDLSITLDSLLLMLETDEVTPEIFILELLNIAVACAFEAFWMRKDFTGRGRGATPGKALMRIRVVQCEKVSNIEGRPPEVVFVEPGTDIIFRWSAARSLMKNLVLAMLLPLTFVLFFFKHYRTGYDVMCRTIVVEDRPRQ